MDHANAGEKEAFLGIEDGASEEAAALLGGGAGLMEAGEKNTAIGAATEGGGRPRQS